jgi:lysophospholipase L1-like esterase
MRMTLLLATSVTLAPAICNSAPATPGDAPPAAPAPPTLFIIGDSTVRNGTRGQMGWGDPIADLFDPGRIKVANRALGGRSSRTFFTEGLWDKVLAGLKPGDFVLMQFGHNDGGPLTGGRGRASLKGNGEETQEVTDASTGREETVHTYGWYLRKYVADAKAKGATPIVLSQIPRNMWTAGKVNRAANDYGKWARQAAEQGGALFIDLNELVAKRYEAEGPEKVQALYFTSADHTHTTPAGARFNAACVVEGVRGLKGCPLAAFLSAKPESTLTPPTP